MSAGVVTHAVYDNNVVREVDLRVDSQLPTLSKLRVSSVVAQNDRYSSQTHRGPSKGINRQMSLIVAFAVKSSRNKASPLSPRIDPQREVLE